jgi:hypothetical protein
MNLIDAALDRADMGLPVFPVGENKKPVCPNGFKDATIDPDVIRRLFSHPAAAFVGIPTGPASGRVILDLDPRSGSDSFMVEHGDKLPKTLAIRTRSNGFHYVFEEQPGVRCSAGKIAPGVDIRADGGYIVDWESAGFPRHIDAKIAPMPAWLVEAATARAASKPKLDGPAVPAPPRDLVDADKLRLMLAGIEDRLNNAEEGGKHAALCRESVLAGGLLYALDENEDSLAEMLVDWLPPVDDREHAIKTAVSGILKGARHPVLIGAAAEFAAVALPEEPELPAPSGDDPTTVDAWLTRDIPEPDRLLGDLLTTTTRVFLIGRTGLGKTMLALDMAASVAAGVPFLHWPAGRPARVLYIDGEMPAELIKPRLRATLDRVGPIPAGNLRVMSRDVEAEARKAFPALPAFEPLNTPGGQQFVMDFIKAVGGVDAVFFDNVMSLLTGDMKDELPWAEVQPLVMRLSAARIGQVWLDHTGHNTDRQYGSSTKAWRMDAVGIMTALKDDADPKSVGFNLGFDFPGKARRRTPDNWQQFAAMTCRLVDGVWSSVPVAVEKAAGASVKVRTGAMVRYEALQAVLARTGRDSTTREEWYAECVNRGLDFLPPKNASSTDRRKAIGTFNARSADLVEAKWIQVNGNAIMDLRGANDVLAMLE